MRRTYLTAIVAMCIGLSLSAQTTQKLTATKASEFGIIYSLPTTVIDITLETETTIKKPGEFYRYAKKYLNADNAIATESKSTTLKSITIAPRGVANKDQQYLMQFKAGSTPFLVINEENLPLAINTEKLPKSKEIALPQPIAATPTPLETEAAQQVISGEIAQSQSSAKRAELAAAQLYALRQTRTDILNGEADQMPADGKAMELVLNNIQAQESALIAMFMGTSQTSTSVETLSYAPGEPIENEVLARISNSEGVIGANDLAGEPIYISINVIEKGELPMTEKGLPKTFPKGGVAYNIPGKIEIKISYQGKVYSDDIFASAQHGVVFGIDPKMFSDKKAPAYLLFDPVTGAIQELGSVSNL